MTRRWLLAALALSTYLAAALQPGPPRRPPGRLLTELCRPALLPGLWSGLARAQRTGDPDEALRLGTLLSELLPEWTDGLVYFAWQLAFDLGGRAAEPERALDLLTAALAWLDRRAAEVLAERPGEAAELLMAMALIVEHRTGSDPALAAAFRRRFRRDPTEVADDHVARAMALSPSEAKRDLRAHLALRLVGGALRMGDVPRAKDAARAARRQLAAVHDQEAARPALAALDRLDDYWRDGDASTLAALEQDPYLQEIAAALRALPPEQRR